MSRVHDALRRAATPGGVPLPSPTDHNNAPLIQREISSAAASAATLDVPPVALDANFLDKIQDVPYNPSSDGLLIDLFRPHEAPMEEFRSLRTRLNHMQTLQPIHSVVVTSASPAEGKSFAAMNLALTQAQLAGNRVLIADFDFRRPIVHNLLQLDRSPGITDFLLGKAPLEQVIKRVAGTNLYVMPAGEAVMNPLELLNLREVKLMLNELPAYFNWIVLDTPPLLFAADANLLSTMCHGTILVVRIGATTIDAITRAMQSLCENNVLGIVVNGARRGELYSKYTYYHSYYLPRERREDGEEPLEELEAPEERQEATRE
jgi:protein-tyrosine kinase